MEMQMQQPNVSVEQNATMQTLFFEEWQEKLESAGYLEHAPELMITPLNLPDILKQLDLIEIVSLEDGLNMLAYYRGQEARFSDFALDLVKCIERESEGNRDS
jgi:hypothetical protein